MSCDLKSHDTYTISINWQSEFFKTKQGLEVKIFPSRKWVNFWIWYTDS